MLPKPSLDSDSCSFTVKVSLVSPGDDRSSFDLKESGWLLYRCKCVFEMFDKLEEFLS
jgi:hypothetical protein